MTTVYGLSADRQLEIEANSIVDARIVNDELILTTFGGTDINVGNVRGQQGVAGPAGSISSINGKTGSSVTLAVADIAGAATQTDLQNATTPAGSILMFAGSTVPTGWLTCDGSAISRSTYSRLFAAISTVYGIGDNSTTFNLPNFKGRVPVGFDSADTQFDTMGETGGEKTHTLTVNEIPAHDHTLDNSTTRATTTNAVETASGNSDNGGNSMASGVNSGRFGRPVQISGTTTKTGGSQAHNVMQPYITTRYIIKT